MNMCPTTLERTEGIGASIVTALSVQLRRLG
jgi:hypothetical protein